jgi:hypothetical protein
MAHHHYLIIAGAAPVNDRFHASPITLLRLYQNSYQKKFKKQNEKLKIKEVHIFKFLIYK